MALHWQAKSADLIRLRGYVTSTKRHAEGIIYLSVAAKGAPELAFDNENTHQMMSWWVCVCCIFSEAASVEHACAQRPFNRRQFVFQCAHLCAFGSDVNDHITNFRIGTQELSVDIKCMPAEDIVDL